MISKLTKLADHLDSMGRIKEADSLDYVIRKLATPNPSPTPPADLSDAEADEFIFAGVKHPHPSLWMDIFIRSADRNRLKQLAGWSSLSRKQKGELRRAMRKQIRSLDRVENYMSTDDLFEWVQNMIFDMLGLQFGEDLPEDPTLESTPEPQIGTAMMSYTYDENGNKLPCEEGWTDTGSGCEK